MADDSMGAMSRYAWGAVVVLSGAAIATVLGFDITRERVGEEVLGALVEVLVGVFAVSILLEKHRRYTEARGRKEQLIRYLYEVWRPLDTAKVLISTHRSAKTIREQFIEMNRLDEPLSDIKHAVSKLGEDRTTRRADDIVRVLEATRALLRDLKEEFVIAYPTAADKQEAFQNSKARGESPSLDAHWASLLDGLPVTARLLQKDALVDDLKEAAAMLRRETLGLA